MNPKELTDAINKLAEQTENYTSTTFTAEAEESTERKARSFSGWNIDAEVSLYRNENVIILVKNLGGGTSKFIVVPKSKKNEPMFGGLCDSDIRFIRNLTMRPHSDDQARIRVELDGECLVYELDGKLSEGALELASPAAWLDEPVYGTKGIIYDYRKTEVFVGLTYDVLIPALLATPGFHAQAYAGVMHRSDVQRRDDVLAALDTVHKHLNR